MTEARRLLERLVKATQPMDFCHVCQSVHSNFKDASNHKEWCAWAKADVFLAQPMTTCESREGELVAALERVAKGRMDIGGKDEAMPRAVMMSEAAAALAQGKKE